MLQSHVQLRHAMKMHMMMFRNKNMKKTTSLTPRRPYPSPLSVPQLARVHSPPSSSSPSPSTSLTHRYEATSAIHAQTGSAPPQKSGSRQPGATAPPRGPARHQHQRYHPPYPYR